MKIEVYLQEYECGQTKRQSKAINYFQQCLKVLKKENLHHA